MAKTKSKLLGEELTNALYLPTSNHIHKGITKREHFAGLAMQGYVVERHAQSDEDIERLAEWSVRMADALLKALSK